MKASAIRQVRFVLKKHCKQAFGRRYITHIAKHMDLTYKRTTVKYAYRILIITYVLRSLLRPSSGNLYKDTDKIQQTAILCK